MVSPGGEAGFGGIGRHVRYVARYWATSGSPLTIQVLDSYGRSSREMPLAFVRCACALGRQALAGRIGLVHLHMAAGGSVLRKLSLLHAAKLMGLPVVLHVHGSETVKFFDGLSPALRAVLTFSMRRADRVIALSASWREFLVNRVGLEAERVHVLPNAVPAPRTGPVRRGLAGPCRILFLGRVGERKGTPVLLRALAQMPNANWELVCAGDGEVSKYRAMASELGLATRVRFLGWMDEDEAQALLADSDLLVLPSLNEGLPMAIIEAMAHGLPVIATPVGGIPELVASGRTGLLVPPADSDALADALQRMIADPQERRRMGADALAVWRERHVIDEYCRELGALYDEILRSRRRLDSPAVAA